MRHNLALPVSESRATMKSLLSDAESGGFDVIAWTVTVDLANTPLSTALLTTFPAFDSPVRQLKRLSIVATTQKHVQQIVHAKALFSAVDVVALVPLSELVFKFACADAAVDLIAIDLAGRLPFSLKFKTLGVALARDVQFEIDVAMALRGGQQRTMWLQNAQLLIRIVKQVSIVLSCAGQSVLEMRSASDLVNIAAILGLPADAAHGAVTHNPGLVVRLGETRRSGAGAVIALGKEGCDDFKHLIGDDVKHLIGDDVKHLIGDDDVVDDVAEDSIHQTFKKRKV